MGNEQSTQKISPLNQNLSEPNKFVQSGLKSDNTSQIDPLSKTNGNLSKNISSRQSFGLKRHQSQLIQGNDGQDIILTLQQIDNLFMQSEMNIDKFFINLQQPLSQLYLSLTHQTLREMNKKYFVSNNNSKLFLSQKILITNLNIMKYLGNKYQHQFDENVFKSFNQLQKNLVGYLKVKYPRSGKNFVPADLTTVFKQFNYIQSPQNDIIRRSGYYFGNQNQRELLKNIKLFLNHLIDQVDHKFPFFQKLLQDRVFCIKVGQQKNFHYKIGRKLSENIAKFTNVNSNSLDIESPEILRVIIKWVGDMEDFLQHPEEQVNQKQTFKVINQQDNHKYTFDQITTQDNRQILRQLITKLKAEKSTYLNDLKDLVKNMYKFQHNLVKIVSQGQLKQKYVPLKEAEVIKFASYNTKFLSWMLAQKLTIVMRKLILVGRSFKNTNFMAPIDLIKFNVTDMLRALITGTKSQILEIYRNLKKLQSSGQIKIIKLKNRLTTPMNDVMIIFTIKDSFLICQLQLILSSTLQQNDKLKNVETLNHFFYQLERSPYGVISELAGLVGYMDSKVGYDQKIHFNNSEVGISNCQKIHSKLIKEVKDQYQPFICTTCSRYFGRLQNTFIMKICDQCNNFLCSQCIFAKNPSFQLICLKQNIIQQIDQNIEYAIQLTRGRQQDCVSGITGGGVYEKSFQKITYIREILKQLKLKKMTLTQFDLYLKQLCVQNLIYGKFQKGQTHLISLNYNSSRNQTCFSFQTNEDFYNSNLITFNDNDFLIFYLQEISFSQANDTNLQKMAFVDIFQKNHLAQKGIYKGFNINKIFLIIGFKSNQQTKNIQIDGVFLSENDISNKKDFKFNSMKSYFQYESILNHPRALLKLHNVGVVSNHLKFFKILQWRNHITEINISNNKITDISLILTNLQNLKTFYASQNFIQFLKIQNCMPSLQTLILKSNRIKEIHNLQRIINLKRINLKRNRIILFPIIKLLKLRSLDISENYNIENLQFVTKSSFPQLNYLNIENTKGQIIFENEKKNQNILILLYPKLKCFMFNDSQIQNIQMKSQILQRIELNNCYCSVLETTISKLQYLFYNDNKLSSIDQFFMKENHEIRVMYLDRNSIKVIPQNIFSTSLMILKLQSNGLVDISALSKANLPNLQHLDLSLNNIQILPRLSFPRLQVLKVQGNNYQNLNQFCQSRLPFIGNLDFTMNRREINNVGRFNFYNLKYLIIQNFTYCNFDVFCLSYLPFLTQLRITQSKISIFPILDFQNLEVLNISSSTIEDMKNLSKCKLPKLNQLSLDRINKNGLITLNQSNQLDQSKYKFDISNQFFLELKRIYITESNFHNLQKVIQMDYKSILSINLNYTIMRKLTAIKIKFLKQLNLQSNQIQDITDFCNSSLPNLEILKLSDNKIQSVENINFPSLIKLELRNNIISVIRCLKLANATLLDISVNELKSFPLIQAPKMADLIFQYNDLHNIENLSLCSLQNIKALSLLNLTLNDKNRRFPITSFPQLQYLNIQNVNFQSIDQINRCPKINILIIMKCDLLKKWPVLKLKQLKNLTLHQLNLDWENLKENSFQSLISLSISCTNLCELKYLKCPCINDLKLKGNNQLINIDQFLNQEESSGLQNIYLINNPQLKITKQFNLKNLKRFQCECCQNVGLQQIGLGNEKLASIYFQKSRIKQLKIKELTKLSSLQCISCSIESCEQFFKQEWKSLNRINLFQNNVSSIEAINHCPQLQFLELQKNKIQDINNLLSNSSILSLKYIFLSDNKISKISCLKNFPLLQWIKLQNNEIEDISFLNNFQNVNEYLLSISLKNNKIKYIPQLKLMVSQLYLQQNLIQDMDFVEKSIMPRLTRLDLTLNKISKLANLQSMNLLQNIVVVGNSIQNYQTFFKKHMFGNNLTYLHFSIPNGQMSKFLKIQIQVQKQSPKLIIRCQQLNGN